MTPRVTHDNDQQPAHAEKLVLPQTPAGRRATTLLQTINLGDMAALRAFVADHYSASALGQQSIEQQALIYALLYNDNRDLTVHAVERATDDEVSVLVHAPVTDRWLQLVMVVDPAPPHAIVSCALQATPSPIAAVEGSISDEQMVITCAAFLDGLAAADLFSGAVLLAKDGQTLFTRAHGWASRSFRVPNRVDTRFNIASMTKMFTAVAIAQLVEQGVLAFEEPISTHLPDYPREVADTVTIHHLLTHTSGMGSFWNEAFAASRTKLRTVSDYIPLFRDEPLSFAPGLRWQYSNAGYVLLGAVIEKMTGQPYDDYVSAHIYQPAGMVNSGTYALDQDTPDLAIGYTHLDFNGEFVPGPLRNNLFLLPMTNGPAGGGYSTVEDLLRFDRALRARTLLSPESTDMVLTGKAELAPDFAYGYGFADDRRAGTRIVGHTGGFPGIETQLDMYLDRGYTVVVLANRDHRIIEVVTEKLRAMILGDVHVGTGARS